MVTISHVFSSPFPNRMSLDARGTSVSGFLVNTGDLLLLWEVPDQSGREIINDLAGQSGGVAIATSAGNSGCIGGMCVSGSWGTTYQPPKEPDCSYQLLSGPMAAMPFPIDNGDWKFRSGRKLPAPVPFDPTARGVARFADQTWRVQAAASKWNSARPGPLTPDGRWLRLANRVWWLDNRFGGARQPTSRSVGLARVLMARRQNGWQRLGQPVQVDGWVTHLQVRSPTFIGPPCLKDDQPVIDQLVVCPDPDGGGTLLIQDAVVLEAVKWEPVGGGVIHHMGRISGTVVASKPGPYTAARVDRHPGLPGKPIRL